MLPDAGDFENRNRFVFVAWKYLIRNTLIGSLDRQLQIWLNSILKHSDNLELCSYAYDNRQSNFINILVRRAQEEEGVDKPSKQTYCLLPRWSIILNSWVPIFGCHNSQPRTLVIWASYLSHTKFVPLSPSLLHLSQHLTLTLCCMTSPTKCWRKMTLRDPMLKEPCFIWTPNSASLGFSWNDTSIVHHKFTLKCSPWISFKMKLAFVGNVCYIACSKPTCLCCEMYLEYTIPLEWRPWISLQSLD